MFFAFVSIIIAMSCAIISERTLVGYSNAHWAVRTVVFVFLLVSWCAPLILLFLHRQSWLPNAVYNGMYGIGHICFGFAFILFVLLFIRDGIWFASYYIFGKSEWWNPANAYNLTKANFVTVLVAICFCVYGWWAATKLPAVKEISIKSNKINHEVVILQVNDLHLHGSKSVKRTADVVDLVNSLKPDIIAMPGDIIDDSVGNLAEHLKELSRLKAPHGVFVSVGNHEFYNGYVPTTWQFEQMGFNLLSENGIRLDDERIFIAGVPDNPMRRKFNPSSRLLKGSKTGDYKILLAHNPKFAKEYLKFGFDLQLSAHTHGGQIFPFHLLTRWVNGYLSGKYKLEDGILYISRGAGYWGPPMRVFAPSDITLITLKPKISQQKTQEKKDGN